jgi:hypothetical protein
MMEIFTQIQTIIAFTAKGERKMRDRLKRLIDDLGIDIILTEGEKQHIADYLINSGVIVPPCKVGTTLYFLYNSPYADKPDLTPRIYKTTNWYFEVDKTGIVINTSDIHSFNKEYDYHLGKTVFLTQEEAEKALERSENEK